MGVRADHIGRPPRAIARLRWPLGAIGVAAIALIVWLALGQRRRDHELLRVALPTGDRLVGTGDARFDIDELSPVTRRFQLRAGTIVFDVAHVAPGQRFEVAAQDFVVVATGTVFSVTSEGNAARVHVYEGSVEILQRERNALDRRVRVPLRAGVTWTRAPATFARLDAPELIAAAERAVEERTEQRAGQPTVGVGEGAEQRGVGEGAEQRGVGGGAGSSSVATTAAPLAPVAATAENRGGGVTRASLPRARKHVADGKLDAALAEVQLATARGTLSGEWYLVRADALRGLGRAREAADAFNIAARKLANNDRIEAAYSAAYLRFHELHDASAALAVLQSFDLEAPGSLLEERALSLHVQILVALDRRDEAKDLARHYLERFEHGGLHTYMRSLVRE